MSKRKPRNRYEEFVKPKFDDFVNYIKDALKDIDNPFEDVSFAVGTGVERAFKQMVKRDEERAKETFPDLYKKWKRGEEFNKGGTVMKDQMEMAFMQEGGLKDDGMDVDPVSGNEIPPGSMASEVRDDIPAQLSEGEYVVPADVVQYFGVKFFEDLRMEAKRGLAEMESNGRIGGEPMDMPPSDMNQGGMMQGNEQTMPVDTGVGYNVGGMTSNLYNDPTKMDQQVSNVMADNPQNMDMQNRTQAMMTAEQMDQINPPPPRRGMSTGGVVPMPTVPNIDADSAAAYNYIASPTTLNPIFATPGATYMAPPDPATMVPPTGGVDSSVPSVENCNKMGMDYDPETKMCVPRVQQPAQPQASGSDDDGDPFANMPKPDPDAWMEKYNYGDMDELAKQTGEAIAGGSNIPGLLGTFDKGVTMAHSAANIILLDAAGQKEEAKQLLEQWNKARTGALKLTPLEMIDGDRFAIQAAGAYGIKLDRKAESIIDGKPLFRNDRDYEKYLANYEVSKKETVAEKRTIREARKLGQNIKGEKLSDLDKAQEAANLARYGGSYDSPIAPEKEAEIQKQVEASVRKDYGSDDSPSNLEKMMEATKARASAARAAERLGMDPKENRFRKARNKGGLMTKKKKKK